MIRFTARDTRVTDLGNGVLRVQNTGGTWKGFDVAVEALADLFAGVHIRDIRRRFIEFAYPGTDRLIGTDHVKTASRLELFVMFADLRYSDAADVTPVDPATEPALCRDCGAPSAPGTEDRPTCVDCIMRGNHANDWTILHMHGAESPRGAAAKSRLVAAGEWVDEDPAELLAVARGNVESAATSSSWTRGTVPAGDETLDAVRYVRGADTVDVMYGESGARAVTWSRNGAVPRSWDGAGDVTTNAVSVLCGYYSAGNDASFRPIVGAGVGVGVTGGAPTVDAVAAILTGAGWARAGHDASKRQTTFQAPGEPFSAVVYGDRAGRVELVSLVTDGERYDVASVHAHGADMIVPAVTLWANASTLAGLTRTGNGAVAQVIRATAPVEQDVNVHRVAAGLAVGSWAIVKRPRGAADRTVYGAGVRILAMGRTTDPTRVAGAASGATADAKATIAMIEAASGADAVPRALAAAVADAHARVAADGAGLGFGVAPIGPNPDMAVVVAVTFDAEHTRGPLAGDPWVKDYARPGHWVAWGRRPSGGPVIAGTGTIADDDMIADIARATGTSVDRVQAHIPAMVWSKAPSAWPVSPDVLVHVHPGFVDLEADGAALNTVMELDTVVEVLPGGRVVERVGMLAPDVVDSHSESDEWELLTGYSGQRGATGANMHSSEFIGGAMARDILARPGLYVAVVDYVSECDECRGTGGHECDDDHVAGWAVAFRTTDHTDAEQEYAATIVTMQKGGGSMASTFYFHATAANAYDVAGSHCGVRSYLESVEPVDPEFANGPRNE